MKKSENNSKGFYFFIGTEAELIKMFPVLLELNKQNVPYKIIASGQNNIENSPLLGELGKKHSDIILFHGRINQTVFGLLAWFVTTLPKGIFTLRNEFSDKKNTVLVIHGDTVSTVMGALIGKFFSLRVAHVEAGLRSFNFFHPFPEELDRIIASRFVSIHFCPNNWAENNIKGLRGVKVNTFQNTLYESLQYILKKPTTLPLLTKVKDKKFFIFVMHRQENILNKEKSEEFLLAIKQAAKKLNCVFIVHGSTKVALEQNNLLSIVENDPHITLTERLSYNDFMHLLSLSECIITDGGSNQEESFYLGKPCLILRKVTERIEGLNENVLLGGDNPREIDAFINSYTKYKRKPIKVSERPSEIIVKYLIEKS